MVGTDLKKSGQSAMEIVLAVGILAVSISAMILSILSSQSVSIDTKLSNQALNLARRNFEDIYAEAQSNFNGLTSSTVTEAGFTKEIIVENAGTNTKKITSRVSWSTSPLRSQKVEFIALVTDWRGVRDSGGDTGGSDPTGNWSNPRTLGSVDLGSGISGTDLDVVGNYVYITVTASAASKPDFFVVDVTNGESPSVIASLNTTDQGLLAIDVAGNYAYVANNNNANNKQLQIIDITNKTAPLVVASYTLPNATEEAISIAYSNNKVYIGLKRNSGPEFFIVDVTTSTNPSFLGSKEIGEDVKAIEVSGGTAYIATPSDNELTILNVTDPANISVISQYNVTGNCEDGKSLNLLGTKMYIGRTDDCNHTNHHKLFILNVSNASSVSSLGSANIGSSVNGLEVHGNLAFLATSDSNEEFQVWDISNPASPNKISSFNFPQVAEAVDYENNYVYVAVRSNDALRIITSQ